MSTLNDSAILNQPSPTLSCEECGAEGAAKYESCHFNLATLARTDRTSALCLACARAERRQHHQAASKDYAGLTRAGLINQLDRFFLTSGVLEICGRCHAQGTGCCPTSCRVLGSHGCDPDNKRGKTVFCSTFICGALLNAIAECDAEIGRRLKWLKAEVGPVEFRLYEMISRTPASQRESQRLLSLPKRYPHLAELEDGAVLKEGLLQLMEEVLEIRRQWKKEEAKEGKLPVTITSVKGK